jgi:hypothetical protein
VGNDQFNQEGIKICRIGAALIWDAETLTPSSTRRGLRVPLSPKGAGKKVGWIDALAIAVVEGVAAEVLDVKGRILCAPRKVGEFSGGGNAPLRRNRG